MVEHHKKCVYCNKKFIARKSNARTCGSSCRSRLSTERCYAKRLEIMANVKDAKDAKDVIKDAKDVKDVIKDAKDVKDVIKDVNSVKGVKRRVFDFDNFDEEMRSAYTGDDPLPDKMDYWNYQFRCTTCKENVYGLVKNLAKDKKKVYFLCSFCGETIGFSTRVLYHFSPYDQQRLGLV